MKPTNCQDPRDRFGDGGGVRHLARCDGGALGGLDQRQLQTPRRRSRPAATRPSGSSGGSPSTSTPTGGRSFQRRLLQRDALGWLGSPRGTLPEHVRGFGLLGLGLLELRQLELGHLGILIEWGRRGSWLPGGRLSRPSAVRPDVGGAEAHLRGAPPPKGERPPSLVAAPRQDPAGSHRRAAPTAIDAWVLAASVTRMR